MARYGILYQIGDEWEFEELLTPTTEALNRHDAVRIDGLTIYEYDIHVNLDLRGLVEGMFVQSYASDTAESWKKKETELITVMIPFDRQEMGDENLESVPISLRVDHRNDMYVTIGEDENDPKTPLMTDISRRNKSFQMSMWPFLE